MRKLFVAMTIAAFALITSVTLGFAADKETDWTGFYLGAHAGLTVGDNKVKGITGLDAIEADAALVGIHGGFDYRLPGTQMVARAMLDYTYSGMVGGFRVPGVKGEYDVAHQLSASAGLGYLITDRIMLYGMGGYTYGYTSDFKVGTFKLPMPDLHGWHVGGGTEVRLSDNWVINAQYRLTDFRDSSNGLPVRFETRDHSGRLGVDYRF